MVIGSRVRVSVLFVSCRRSAPSGALFCVVVVQRFVAAQRVDHEGVHVAEERPDAQLLRGLHEVFQQRFHNGLTQFILQGQQVDDDVIFVVLLLTQLPVHRSDHPLDVAGTHADGNVAAFELLLQDPAELGDDAAEDVERHVGQHVPENFGYQLGQEDVAHVGWLLGEGISSQVTFERMALKEQLVGGLLRGRRHECRRRAFRIHCEKKRSGSKVASTDERSGQ